METGAEVNDNRQDRWDRASVHEFAVPMATIC